MQTPLPQFDKAEIPSSSLECAFCTAQITESYYQAVGKTCCHQCKDQIDLAAVQRQQAPMAKFVASLAVGIPIALAGAALYWIVAKLTGYELALISIAIGWAMGWAFQKIQPWGSRPTQILAAGLTYVSCCAAKVPFMVEPGDGFALWMEALQVALTYPPTHIVSDILGALILGFGVWQAWSMTGPRHIEVQGPYRVGTQAL